MNPADLTLNISPSLSSKALPTSSLALKNGRVPVPRVDLEPIYTQLKAALGDGWGDYKAAVNAFVLGGLNQSELTWVLAPLLFNTTTFIPSTNTSSSTISQPVSTLQLHNTLLISLHTNILRDSPPTEVAPWVVATDKPATASKNAGASGANDKAEERLKKEVMSLSSRDRKRIKALKEPGKSLHDGLADMLAYRHELAVKQPDIAPSSGGGLQRTNWDVEIRRRYAQTLAQESLEFPTLGDVQSRIEPICYEEGLVSGCAQGALQGCAELVEQATEVFLKELLTGFYSHTRSNGENCVQTGKFRRQVRKEEADFEHGVLQRNATGFLPVETEARSKRKPLNMDDMHLSLQLEDGFMTQDPFLSHRVLLNRQPNLKPPGSSPKVNGVFAKPTVNGSLAKNERAGNEDVLMTDALSADMGWRGATKADAMDLGRVLDDCLAAG